MIAFSDLITAQTRTAILNVMLDVIETAGVPARQWRAKGVAASILMAIAAVGAGFSGWIVMGIMAGFLELAPFNATNGGWLALLSWNVYGVQWQGPQFAEGDVTLTNTGGGIYFFAAGDFVVRNSVTKKTYVNTEDINLGAFEEATFSFQAQEQGSASTSGPGEIDASVTSAPNVTFSNAEAVVGSDGQTQVELIAACKAKLALLSPNGAADAYSFLALADPTTIPLLVKLGLATQTSVAITRALPVADGLGGVNIYLATANGAPVSGDVAIIDARLQAVCRPLGIRVTTLAATPIVIPVSYEGWLKSAGIDQAGAEAAFAIALAQYFASLQIGGYVIPPDALGKVRTNALEGVLFAGTPGVIEAVVAGADTTLAANQVAVLGTITPTVHLL